MRITETVFHPEVCKVWTPKVVHKSTAKRRHDPCLIHRLLSAFLVYGVEGEQLRRGYVDPSQSLLTPYSSFICMENPGSYQMCLQCAFKWFKMVKEFSGDVCACSFGYMDTKKVIQCLCSTSKGNVLIIL